ncbi:MAG: radical SAM protein [Hyphomicrobiales bacterium]
MNELTAKLSGQPIEGKFTNPDITLDGEARAKVPFERLDTLWINTGSLCNIECAHCYILSSPKNDDLVYIRLEEVLPLFDEIKQLKLSTKEIAFTGGEPFMNPEMIAMAEAALMRDFSVLILTNAMAPMMRKSVRAGLLDLQERFGERLNLRISLDHYTEEFHDKERGKGSFAKSLTGLNWLNEHGFQFSIAGRSLWDEDAENVTNAFQNLFDTQGWSLSTTNPDDLMIFPEMDEQADKPEITEKCWDILGLSPKDLMCSSSRMVVKRKGETSIKILPCTLLPYRADFEMGDTLEKSLKIDGGMFDEGAVKLCHIHCSKFCVLGGGSCTS